MKKNILTFLILIIFTRGFAQQSFTYNTREFKIPLGGIVDLSTPAPQFDPKLMLLKALVPAPLSEVKLRKAELDLSRQNFKKKYSSVSVLGKTTAAAPTAIIGFNGNSADGAPNDNDIAVSNGGKIVSVTNTNLYFFNDTGGTGVGPTSLSFFAYKALGTLNRTYDPRVIYDPKKDRFIVVFLQGTTHSDTRIILGFSQSNDPQKKWNFYSLPGNITGGDSSWSDYPIVALTDDELFVTVNRVKDNTPWQTGFVESYIWQVNKQNGYDSASVLNSKVYNNIKYNGKTIWSICPARGGSTTHGPNMYLLSVRPSDLRNDTVFLHEITNTIASGSAQLTLNVLRTDVPYGLMPNAYQPGYKKLQTNDARVLSACYEGGFLYYTGNTIDSATLNPSMYLGKIKNIDTGTPIIEGKIIKSDTMDFGYPSVTYAGGGGDDRGVMITHSFVSPNQYPGTAVIYVDRYGNVSPTVFLKKGISLINTVPLDTVQRWGDYTGIQRKYNETSSFVLSGSYGSNSWNYTWIAKVKNSDLKYAVDETNANSGSTKVYPNPTSDYLHIEFDMEETAIVEFDITDITGRNVTSLLRDRCIAGINMLSLRVNDLKEGIYVLNIRNENHVIQSKKFIVSH